MFGPCFVIQYCVPSSFAIILIGSVCVCVCGGGGGCCTLIVFLVSCYCTVNPVLSGNSKLDKTNILMTDSSIMKVGSIAECSREHSAMLSTCIKR